jgi:hypothetical protein
MRFLDHKAVARDHLYAYNYSDHRSLELLQKNVMIYNGMVMTFINNITEEIDIYLKIQLPYIRQYNPQEDPQSNFYHYSSILYYLWLVFWQSRDGRHETWLETVQYGFPSIKNRSKWRADSFSQL